ncbi:MAG: tetratricopeptide repeat protein, partial [Bacteroidia bacterium]|nr:tetratricopeptide repeat protein [Bacteroidia bacterium]
MKKIIVAAMLLLFATAGFTQKVEIQNASNYLRNEQLGEALEAADKAVVHPDTKADHKAWFYKGAICLEINNLYKWKASCEPGITREKVEETMASFGNEYQPIKPISDKRYKFEDGSKGRRLIYKYNLEYIFNEENILVEIVDPTQNKFADRNFLKEAEEALLNSITYNTEDEDLRQKALANMGVIYDNLFNLAVLKYNEKAYLESADAFEKAYNILTQLGTTDSSSMNNANLAYKLAIQEEFDAGNYDKALEIIDITAEKYPEDIDIIVTKANIYLKLEDNEKTIETLSHLMKIDDTNPTIFFAAGASYDQLGDYTKAAEAYQKAIELNPDYFDPNYNLGALYVNKAAEIQE